MTVRLLFPTSFYQVNLKNHDSINKEIVPALLDLENNQTKGGNPWIGFVFNTMGTYEIHSQPIFSKLYAEVKKYVNRFAQELHVRRNLEFNCEQSWANIYHKHDYQESHFHPNFTFSAVYYAQTTPNTKIIFENPVQDMFPLEVEASTDVNKTYETIYPNTGDLLVFRSYLRHQIPIHSDNETKITIAFNFK
jgi:uncharacterized protein (TIGR02466 family)